MSGVYFILAECQNHIDKLKDSWCIQAKDADTAFDLAKGEIIARAAIHERWVIIDFKRIE